MPFVQGATVGLLPCPERSEGNPRMRPRVLEEATVGFEPTHGGFAGPDCGDSDPCSPLAGFRVRVCVFSGAWHAQTLDRLQGRGNGHNVPRSIWRPNSFQADPNLS